MPKMKTKKSLRKRFRKTATGKLIHLGAGRGHHARRRRCRPPPLTIQAIPYWPVRCQAGQAEYPISILCNGSQQR